MTDETLAAIDSVDLSAAAATVVYDLANCDTEFTWDRGRTSGVVALWQNLTGIVDRAEAIAYAHTIADHPHTITAHIPPF